MGDSEHFEISLQKSVFARSTMLHDIYEVKLDFLAIDIDRKIILVNLRPRLFRERYPHGVLFPVGHQ